MAIQDEQAHVTTEVYHPNTLPCQNCKRPFHVSHADRSFYDKVGTPPPTFCPSCRLQRRLAFRNERTLYKRICDLCKKSVISMYAPGSDFVVYCPDCFYSDRWDAMSYGRRYDFNQNFFEQLMHLQRQVPRISLFQWNAVSSPWINYEADAKNCYLNVGGQFNENSAYNQYALKSQDCFDTYMVQDSQFCYESVFCEKSYKTWYSTLCFDCRDVYFSFDCRDCSNIIGCTGLRHKQYHIFNRPVSKEEFEKFMRDHPLDSYEAVHSLKRQAHEFWKSQPQRAAYIEQSTDATGHIILESRNSHDCISVEQSDSVRYGLLLKSVKDSMDVTSIWKEDLLYEVIGGERVSHVLFSSAVHSGSAHIEYCDYAGNCQNCFGCISLRNKQYCILNYQYDKHEYMALVAKIRAQMLEMPFRDKKNRTYSYGEFFPYELSPFGYNETIANEYFPLEKEIILKDGYEYEDAAHEQKYEFSDYVIPDRIEDVGDDILEKVLKCEGSGRAYRIIPMELEFYRRFGIAIPHLAPFERHRHRLQFVSHHRQTHVRDCAHCHKQVSSAYTVSEFPHVYCDKCYATEIL